MDAHLSHGRQTGQSRGVRGPVHAFLNAMKFCIFVGINAGGAVGWWLGEMIGTMTAFFVSGAGSLAGVYLGWRVAMRMLN